jgi:hypothetical protein
MRCVAMLMGAALCTLPQLAAAQDTRDSRADHGDRQNIIASVLAQEAPDFVNAIRGNCAAGRETAWIAQRHAAGAWWIPDAADYCVAALTRIGRDGTLSYVHDGRSQKATPAESFDTGFVTAFRKHEAVTSELPTMLAMKPLAERCLAQAEPNTALCSAVGYAFGVRAASGETVVVQ